MTYCLVCGLRADQLPPLSRLVHGTGSLAGSLVCRHKFGIPAQNVPDWRAQQITFLAVDESDAIMKADEKQRIWNAVRDTARGTN